MSLNANLLADQLGQLGRDLDSETHLLSTFEDQASTLEGKYQRLKELHEDALAKAFLAADGSVEVRKSQARLACTESRAAAQDALDEWNKSRSLIRMQAANISALRTRIDIGRSLLSNEKSQLALAQSGVS